MGLAGLLSVAVEGTGYYERPLIVDLSGVEGAGAP